MGGLGRSFCVSLPFILTAVSIVCLLIVGLAGVTGSNLSLFEVIPKDLNVNLDQLKDLKIGGDGLDINTDRLKDIGINTDDLDAAIAKFGGLDITAEKLGLGDKYNFFLWNWVEERGGNTIKTKAQFNYASVFNTTNIGNLADGTGASIEVPQTIDDGLKTFATCIKWSEILFIVAIVMHAATLLVGIGACFSRIGSCVTWVVSSVALAAITGFAALTTVTGSVVVGTINAAAEQFGVKSSVNTAWLAIIWIGVAAGVASGIFWMVTICCCKGSVGRGSKRDSRGDTEKLMGGTGGRGYQPIHDQQTGIYNQQQYAIPMTNVKTSRGQAYEPYSHHAT